MIRRLHTSEVSLMVEAAKMFVAEGSVPGGLNPEHFVRTWKSLIESGTGVVFAMFGIEGEICGALGAVQFPDLFNGDKVAAENFWYMIPRYRGRGVLLLREFEAWARSIGCKRVSMVHLQKLNPERLKEFYTDSGYEHVESAYIKDLTITAHLKAEPKEELSV